MIVRFTVYFTDLDWTTFGDEKTSIVVDLETAILS